MVGAFSCELIVQAKKKTGDSGLLVMAVYQIKAFLFPVPSPGCTSFKLTAI